MQTKYPNTWLEIWLHWSWDKFLGLVIGFSISYLGFGPAFCSWFRRKTIPKVLSVVPSAKWDPSQLSFVAELKFSVHSSLTRASTTGAFSNTKLVPAPLFLKNRLKNTLEIVICDPSYSILPGRKETAKVTLSLPTVAWKTVDLAIWKFWLKKNFGFSWGCHVTVELHFFRKIKVLKNC